MKRIVYFLAIFVSIIISFLFSPSWQIAYAAPTLWYGQKANISSAVVGGSFYHICHSSPWNHPNGAYTNSHNEIILNVYVPHSVSNITLIFYGKFDYGQTNERMAAIINRATRYGGETSDWGGWKEFALGPFNFHQGINKIILRGEHWHDWQTCPMSSPSHSIHFESIGWVTFKGNPPAQPPTVNITANPSIVSYNGQSTLTWTSTNANTCTASGDWSGSKALSGSELTGNLTSSKVYTITCSGPGGTASDSVSVSVQAGFPSCNTYLTPSNPKVNDGLTLHISSNNCYSANYQCYGSLAGFSGSASCNTNIYLGSASHSGQGWCNVYVYGQGGSSQCSNSTYIQNQDQGTISTHLLVRKTSSENWQDNYTGFVPLMNLDLRATVSETYSGLKTYKFDCNNDGSWDYIINSQDDTYSVYNICNYQNPGTYTAKVRVEKGSLSAQDTATIVVKSKNISVSLTPTPASGYSPLLTTLKAQVPSSISGPFTYTFWWDCNSNCSTISQCKAQCGNYNYRSQKIYNHFYFVSHYYTYTAGKIYHPKVLLEKNSLAATDIKNVLVFYKYRCINCEPTPPKQVVTISGRVYKQDTNQGVAGAKVYLCNLGTVTTDANGYWHRTVYKGQNFCVRLKSIPCPEYKPIVLAVNNNNCHKNSSTYESQVAGESLFSNCSKQGPSSWDLYQDNVYDFGLKNPYISVSLQATSSLDNLQKINIYAKTSGTLAGVTDFYFWWNCDSSCNSFDECQKDCGLPNYKLEGSNSNYLAFSHTYPEKKSYSLKVLVKKGNYFAQDKTNINFSNISSQNNNSFLATISKAGWFRSLLFFLIVFLIFFILLWILRIFLFGEK